MGIKLLFHGFVLLFFSFSFLEWFLLKFNSNDFGTKKNFIKKINFFSLILIVTKEITLVVFDKKIY